MDLRLIGMAEIEEAIAEMIDKQRPGYFLEDDPVARHAAGAARARATALRALAAEGFTLGDMEMEATLYLSPAERATAQRRLNASRREALDRLDTRKG